MDLEACTIIVAGGFCGLAKRAAIALGLDKLGQEQRAGT